MTTSQTNKLNMYEVVFKTLTDNQAVWNNTSAMNEAVNEINQLLPQIRNVGAQRTKSTAGVTKTKMERKELMAKKATLLSSLAFAYAEKEKNQSLKTILTYSYTDIFRSKDNIAIDICTAIYQQISELLPVLSAYGITETDTNELQQMISSFAAAIGEKGNVKSNRVAGTQTLATLFTEMDALLRNRLDKLMLRYRDTHAVFFNTYVNARTIRDLGGSKSVKKEKTKKIEKINA